MINISAAFEGSRSRTLRIISGVRPTSLFTRLVGSNLGVRYISVKSIPDVCQTLMSVAPNHKFSLIRALALRVKLANSYVN